ncbi:hypothetical protein [Streptomyces sp. NPDC058964]|uniref:hypothetical protein n=1 Tax=Streptomyces sp. NPDC058964 TaxID=3346681 RepID=UPI0036B35695
MSTVHTLAEQLWSLLPALTAGLKFATAAVSFGLAARTAATRIRARLRRGNRAGR